MDSLSVDRFRQIIKLLNTVTQEETKEKLISGAWIGFQMGAAGDKTFGMYLDKLGLSDTEKVKPITAAEAIAKAEKIRAIVKANRDK